MIYVRSIMNKKEDDGTWTVKAQWETRTVYGYGESLADALKDASDSLTSAFKKRIKVSL